MSRFVGFTGADYEKIRHLSKIQALERLSQMAEERINQAAEDVKYNEELFFCLSYSLDSYLRQVEIDAIRCALAKNNGHLEAAAAALGLKHPTLHDKITRYKIWDEDLDGARRRLEAERNRLKAIDFLNYLVG